MNDFDTWNKKKQKIHYYKKSKFYNEREMWWCSFGQNIGSEHNGSKKDFQRPVLILKGLSVNTCLVAPLTKSRSEHKYRIKLGMIGGKEASVVLSQIRVIDTKRLSDKSIDTVDEVLFEKIKTKLKEILEL